MSELEVQSEIYNEKSTFIKVTTLSNTNLLVLLEFYNDIVDNIQVDEEGDILVPRSKRKLELEFSPSTTLNLVGLQIWRGAFLLADYILSHSDNFKNANVLELGSGVGFAGIVAGVHANEVVCTDINQGGILELIKRNVKRNKHVTKCKISVTSLDFYQHQWSAQLDRIINQTNIIIAADVIYDDSLTEAFIHCITKLLQVPPKKKLYIALEKRYVFTLEHLESVAPCYEYFLKYLKNYWSKKPMYNWTIKQINIDFEQFFEYDRTKQLILWEISV